MDDAEFFRWYGPWVQLSPSEIAKIMAGMPSPWWIVGGWAIEAFTGQPREHEDTDVAIFRSDLPDVLDHLTPDYNVWSNLNGAIRPLRASDDLLDGCRQLWVRKDSGSPWLFDLLLTPHESDTWISIRDDRVRRQFAESVFASGDGIRYLKPEMVLHLKAQLKRPKDSSDFAAAVPMLEPDARTWLRSAIEIADPDNPWLDQL